MATGPNEISCGLRNVGTYGVPGGTTATEAIERRANGTPAQGQRRFQHSRRCTGLSVGAPYFHHGQAATLAAVLTDPLWPRTAPPAMRAARTSAVQVADLISYLY